MSRWERNDRGPNGLEGQQRSAARESSAKHTLSDDELLAAAQYYRDEDRFEDYLVKERGLERESPELERTVGRWKVERARMQEERRVPRRGAVDPEAQRMAREKALELIQAARRSETREEFEEFLGDKYGVSKDSADYETFMTAWARYKQEKEGF